MKRRMLRLSPLIGALVLAGCASVAPDGLRSAVNAHTAARLPAGSSLPTPEASATAVQQQATEAQIAQWLSQPVDADTAVRIALLRSPGLQAQLAQLARQDAQRAQALTLFNPTLTLGRFVNGHEREIERQFSVNLVQRITQPWRSQRAQTCVWQRPRHH